MDRKKFLKSCGCACLVASPIGMLLQSCVSTKTISSPISGDGLVVSLSEFEKVKKDIVTMRDYIIIQNDRLQFPIYVFRFSEKEFSALYLQCTHQGNELNAYGEKLVCSAHGSEFDNKGNVTNGPATKQLKSFPILLDDQNITISLKAV